MVAALDVVIEAEPPRCCHICGEFGQSSVGSWSNSLPTTTCSTIAVNKKTVIPLPPLIVVAVASRRATTLAPTHCSRRRLLATARARDPAIWWREWDGRANGAPSSPEGNTWEERARGGYPMERKEPWGIEIVKEIRKKR